MYICIQILIKLQESLFYLACRGIDPASARAVVVKGFALEMIQELPDSKAQVL
jgi:Fe-S cluster assembly scaffold protein SufB